MATTKQPKQTKQTKAQAASAMPTAAAPVVPAAPAQPAPTAPVLARAGWPLTVRPGARPYRSAAPHNQQWWANVQAAIAAGNGTAPLLPLLQAGQGATAGNYTATGTQGAPGHFVGYCLRKGYLLPA